MNKIIRGRVWKFGDNLNSDLMYPAAIMHGKQPKEKMKFFCMQANRPEFATAVQQGDILLAGENCGCGSTRPAAALLKELGIECVLADSFAAIFFRNSISSGMPVIESRGISGLFEDGDTGEIDLEKGLVTNVSSGEQIVVPPLPPEILEILDAGGMLEYIQKDLKARMAQQ